jgi:hypothetical protein
VGEIRLAGPDASRSAPVAIRIDVLLTLGAIDGGRLPGNPWIRNFK